MTIVGKFPTGYMFVSPLPRFTHAVVVGLSDCPELPKRLKLLACMEGPNPVLLRGRDKSMRLWIEFQYKQSKICFCETQLATVVDLFDQPELVDGPNWCRGKLNSITGAHTDTHKPLSIVPDEPYSYVGKPPKDVALEAAPKSAKYKIPSGLAFISNLTSSLVLNLRIMTGRDALGRDWFTYQVKNKSYTWRVDSAE